MSNQSRRFYNQHDGRSNFSNQTGVRKVSFKNNSRRGNSHPNHLNQRRTDGSRSSKVVEYVVRDIFDQGVDELPVQPSRGRRSAQGINSTGYRLKESSSGWYSININKAGMYEGDYILNLLTDYVKPYTLEHFGFKKLDDDTYTFIVSHYELAEKLFLSKGRIKTRDNRYLFLYVRPVSPYVDMSNENLKQLIIEVMGRRYNPQNKALDLSEFHKDPAFIEVQMFAPIDRTNVMRFVIETMGDNLPDLHALNLSGNRIYHRDTLTPLVKVVPLLKILYLADNNIRDISMLKQLKGLDIEEINLHGNPFLEKEKYKDTEMYMSEVRSSFPKIRKIDDRVLPPPRNLPKSLFKFLVDEKAGPLAREFLEQYYAMFDSNNRGQLEVAYHEKAQLSLLIIDGVGNNFDISRLIKKSRNFLRIQDPQRLKSLLSVGKKDIIRELRLLPETKHDFTSMTCDCPVFHPNLIQLIVSGIFLQRHEVRKNLFRGFNRMFLLKPSDSGLSIINDQFFITSATLDQLKYAISRESKPSEPSTSSASSLQLSNDTNMMSQPPQPSNNTEILIKQKMVLSLSAATKMNIEYSEKCLVENNWNYDAALALFNELMSASSIPSVVFE